MNLNFNLEIQLLKNQQYINGKTIFNDFLLEEELGLDACSLVDILLCNNVLCKNSIHFKENRYLPKGYVKRVKSMNYRYCERLYIYEKDKWTEIDALIFPYAYHILDDNGSDIAYNGVMFTQKGREWFLKNYDAFMAKYMLEKLIK